MAECTKIEWCHATFNPWRGCRAISDACANCYAKALVEGRLQQDFGIRTRAAESTWNLPLRWNRKAAKEGRRMRVFCASLADVFDAEVPDAWRDDLFALIAVTPHLDWLLLTKRPKVMHDYLTDNGMPARISRIATNTLIRPWPWSNVWLGTTVENQAMAEARIPHLLETPAAVRFLSMEPLLGPVNISDYLWPVHGWWKGPYRSYREAKAAGAECGLKRQALVSADARFLNWVITGGESGPGARPSHPDWFRSVRDQCAAAGVPFLFKQWGEWASAKGMPGHLPIGHVFDDGYQMMRLGKKAAGRHLDGMLHDGYPGSATHG